MNCFRSLPGPATVSIPRVTRKSILTVLTLFWLSGASAQPGFSKLYDFGSPAINFSNIILTNDTLVVSGNIFPDSLNRWCAMFVLMDTTGTVLSMHYFPDTLNDSFFNDPGWTLIRTSDGGYLTTGETFHAGAAVKMNKDGSLGFYSTFPSNRFTIKGAAETADGFLLAGTFQHEDLSKDVILLKVNKQGHELWRKYYDDMGRRMNMNDLYVCNSNKIILTASSGENVSIMDSTIYPFYWVLDSTGNILKTWRHPVANLENGMRNLQILPNGNWIYSSAAFLVFSNTNWTLIRKLVCRDSNMNLIWQRFIPEYTTTGQFTNNIQPSGDGNWLAVGNIFRTVEPYIQPFGLMLKFSSSGDSIWQRTDVSLPFTTSYESGNYLGRVVTLPSGNIIAAGNWAFFSDSLNRYSGWLLKISKDGCLDEPDCPAGPASQVAAVPALDIMISPNPVTDRAFFEIPDHSGRLQITDIRGTAVFDAHFRENIAWNTSSLPNGVYFYRVVLQDGQVRSGKMVKI